jgi:hypothetical protein
MSEQQQIRRYSDGSIDFEFYRLRAVHERSLAAKAVMRWSLASVQRALKAAIALIGHVSGQLAGLRIHRVAQHGERLRPRWAR